MGWNYEYAVTPPQSAPPAPPEPEEPPPGPVEDPSAFPRWPLWAPVAALGLGLIGGILAVSFVVAVLTAAGVDADEDAPGLTAAGTFLIDVCVVAAAVLFASRTLSPRRWHFGLRSAPIGLTVKRAAAGLGLFYLFALVYGAVVKPDNPQRVVQDLGADTNTALLIAGALVVIVVAPVCEEVFFRGFVYRVLRSRLSFGLAVAIDGVVFGAVHGINVVLPILVVLGVILCWVYERTGTLYAPIALHAFNNTISYGVTTEDGWGVSLAVGGVMLVVCALAVMRPRRAAGAPA